MDVYVFDIDGVLLDVSERVKKAQELSRGRRELFWQYFFSEELMELDKPRRIGIDLLMDRACKGLIAIVTGRPRRLYRYTLQQLSQIGIDRSKIWRIEMRDEGDYRKSYIVKLEKILNIVYEGYNIVEVHDDDIELLQSLRRYLPRSKLYLHRGDGYHEITKPLI